MPMDPFTIFTVPVTLPCAYRRASAYRDAEQAVYDFTSHNKILPYWIFTNSMEKVVAS